jgi:non-specific serine/threonine protein kinase
LAVTGTPVENHVMDLWSLMAFTNPGLLPRRTVFKRRFAGADPTGHELRVLRGLTSPFVLRRVKSDPAIAPDLPDRTIVRDDCALTKEQVGAYEAAVRVMLRSLDEPGLKRRASVLGSISRLKQICVHPALLTESRSHLAGRSGKIDRLTELCAEIVDEGQAVVVFTQFASFAGDLAEHLAEHVGVEALTLTGAHSRTRRAATVERFNRPDGPPILVASIKAGGTGLTLVRANHVVHVDRWWNPAVEDQASDRVWRIGQTQKVIVHTLVCPGTLEDKIDSMLTAKRGVAEAVVTATDRAVTELSDAELTSLVNLSRDRLLT